MNQNKSKELHLGLFIGLVCLSEEDSTIVCSLCDLKAEFSKLLNFISHIALEHGCTRRSDVDYTAKIKSEFIDVNSLEQCKENGSSCETAHPRDYLRRMDDSTFTKEICNETDMNIVKNEIVEIGSKEFYCHHCKTNFLSEKEVVNHICINVTNKFPERVEREKKSIHIDECNYKCEICNKTFPTLKGFRTHKTRIHRKNDESFSEDLIKREPTTSNYFKCMYCPQSYISSLRLKMHLQTHEPSSGKTVSCPHCPAILKSKVTLKYHLLRHVGQKTFKCDYCNGSYFSSSRLRDHLKKSHAASIGLEFCCALCSAVLKSQKSLNLHILKHKGEKPYKCEQCSRTFYRSDQLKRHILIHSGKKPFKCEQCSSAFCLEDRLKVHMLMHSGEKPYKCEQCSSAFYRKDRLQAHILKHGGKKRYECEYCACSFTRADRLKRHMGKHTEKEITKVEVA